MKKLVPYLIFNGNCKEAMEYYASAMEGKITLMQTFDEAPVEFPEDASNRIFDSELKSKGVTIKASDSPPGQDIPKSNHISLMVYFEDPDTQRKVYNNLAEDGEVSMELSEQTGFAMLTDKFGVSWMLAFEQ